MSVVRDCWYAVAVASEVRRKPKQILFFEQPIVLFDSGGAIAALPDRCPHRFAELSQGRVVNGAIECPYHGWRFNAAGACTAIPGLVGEGPSYRLPPLKTTEKDGVVFIARGSPSEVPYLHAMEGKNVLMKRVQSSTHGSVIDAAENILDAIHTHYIHKGLLRGLSSQRQLVRVDISGGAGWVEATYTGEERQHGLVSRLLEGERLKTIGRFRFPGIAELEYWGKSGLVLATTFHLRQATADTVNGIGCLVGPRESWRDHLKSVFFRPMFHLALEQDRRILKAASRNALKPPMTERLVGPLDFLRLDIEAIIRGDLPAAAEQPRTAYIEL